MNRWKNAAVAAAGLALVIVGVAGCGEDDTEDTAAQAGAAADQAVVTVSEAWTRQPASSQTRAAVYATLTNDSDEAVQVVSATSPVTDQVELHETVSDEDGVMSMREVSDGFTIPAGGEFRFEAGGPHIMLVGIDPASFPADHLQVTLSFDAGAPVLIEAAVEELAGPSGDDDHDHHEHDDEHDHDDTTSGHDDEHHDYESAADPGDSAPDDDPLSVARLHELDEELLAGTIDPPRQRAVIAPFIANYEDLGPEPGSPEAALLDVLGDLDTALAADDLARASELATEAHIAGHALEDHDH